MWQFVLRRCLLMIPIFVVVSIIIFSLIHIVPGTPIDNLIGPGMTKAHEQKLVEKYDLDKPVPVQYFLWFKKMLHGDLGRSIIEKRPVTELLLHHLPYSLTLGLTAIVLSFMLGVSMGIISAAAKNTIFDHLAMLVALFGVTIPSFWLGLILILIFAVWLP
ncbi:MAG: ABC transporter permease, partial [Desulfobacteraceae bacterium]|nr:ABC transporter permease [Desulfobacteraceae bacterium]